MRNTLEEAIRNQSIRIVEQPDLAVEELTRLTLEDFHLTASREKRNGIKRIRTSNWVGRN